MFYEFNQNNSGGSFQVDDKVCHVMYIEANNENEAINKAEELGCYWNGVSQGRDCPCCGDRWHTPWDHIELEKYQEEGLEVGVYSHYKNAEELWQQKYGKYEVLEEPKWEQGYSLKEYVGKVTFKDIEEYAQLIADKYGWTTPDIRIYYLDGTVKEIFSDKDRA